VLVALFVVDGPKVAKNIDLSIFFFRMFVVYALPKATSPDIPAEACASLRCLAAIVVVLLR
jgi:hypothetical protein